MENILHIGSIIYINGSRKITIDRVTRTRAYAGPGYTFKREYADNGYVTLFGGSIWTSDTFYIETPERKQKYEERQVRKDQISQFKSADISSLSTDQLRRINSIINEPK